jgi:2-C-methyl-D-erythritol 4-phosphate cytidylyltransferase
VSNKKFALIVAGGSGKRMNSTLPKQFIAINGKPLLMHTIEAFIKNDPSFEIFVVLPEAEMDSWKSLCLDYSFHHRHTLVGGGATRFHSVKKGLNRIREEGIVFIHDGVRPLVSSQTIDNCYAAALIKGNALPVIAPSESIREATGFGNRAVDRSRYFLVQTPQTFRLSLIKNAYSRRYTKKFTDDASVLEEMGHTIHMVEGNRENIKITFPQDLIYAEFYLRQA